MKLRAFLLTLLILLPAGLKAGQEEQRGVWLATVGGIDWPDGERNHFIQRSSLISTIRELAAMGCNTLYFQVVSEMDAMYSSDYLPWSRELTGVEGMPPYFDPLSIATLAAHEAGMEIHAWINPLRVSRSDTTARARECVKYTHPEWVKDYKGKEYLDPGNPEVVQFLSEIVTEILEKYDVDGIHMDDYFYPDGLQKDDSLWDDSALYREYGAGMGRHEWRFSNIDTLVATLHSTVHRVKPGALFGISPAGLPANTRRLYADPSRWKGHVDYLIPQIYWCMDRGDYAAFPNVLPQWKGFGVPVYVGIAAYKHDSAFYRNRKDSGYRSMGEFKREIDLCRKSKHTNGHVWFRARYILEDGFRKYVETEIY